MPLSLIRPARLAALVVLIAAVVPYLPTIHDYFMQDDFGVVWLLSQKPALHFPHWFAGPWMEDIWGYVPDEIRPFPALSYQIAAQWGANSPVANHLLNIALHAANACLVMGLAGWAAGTSLPAATLAGVVFAVLPMQAESVAWVTGRVDSLPAFFYLGSFALFVRWRVAGARATYAWSVVIFFMALFSKQNTITLAPALVLYDLILGRAPLRLSWNWLRPYVPYVVLTAGYLLLRYLMFHEVAREGVLTSERFSAFASDLSRHLTRLVYGDAFMRMAGMQAVVIVVLIVFAVWLVRARGRQDQPLMRPLVYFGAVWIALGAAPTLVAGYYSPRHMYLASAGWAVLTGVLFNVVWDSGRVRFTKIVAVAAGVVVVAFYSIQLRAVVRDWNHRAFISHQAVIDLEREVALVPNGTLVIVGVPASSWEYSVPYSARPPFMGTDLAKRVLLVSDQRLHCCPVNLWEDYTRKTFRAWLSSPERPPVIGLYWNGQTGAYSRLTEAQEPYLRPLISVLLQTTSRAALDEGIRDLLTEHVALVAPVVRPQ